MRLGGILTAMVTPFDADGRLDEGAAVRLMHHLLENGVYVNLALPPGTPNGVCLLRCSVSAAHTADEIAEVCRRFARVAAELGSPAADAAPRAAHG